MPVTKAWTDVPIGTIFRNTWGYEQTNQDFYEVVGKRGQSLTLRQLKTRLLPDGDMTGHAVPLPGEYNPMPYCGGLADRLDYPIIKRPFVYEGDILFAGRIFLNAKYGSCEIWDGKPAAYSTYA